MKSGFLGYDPKEYKANINDNGNDTWSDSTLGTIGLAVKNAMLIPEKTANRYMYINSFKVSQNQVLASSERATGKIWEVTHVDPEEIEKMGMGKRSRGNSIGATSLIRYILCVDGHGENHMNYAESADQLPSLPKQTLDEVVAELSFLHRKYEE